MTGSGEVQKQARAGYSSGINCRSPVSTYAAAAVSAWAKMFADFQKPHPKLIAEKIGLLGEVAVVAAAVAVVEEDQTGCRDWLWMLPSGKGGSALAAGPLGLASAVLAQLHQRD